MADKRHIRPAGPMGWRNSTNYHQVVAGAGRPLWAHHLNRAKRGGAGPSESKSRPTKAREWPLTVKAL